VKLRALENSVVALYLKRRSNVSACLEQSHIFEDSSIQRLNDFLRVIDSGRLDEKVKIVKYIDCVQFQNRKLSVLDWIE
jgi:hypothetical protein